MPPKKTQKNYHKHPVWGLRLAPVYQEQMRLLTKQTRRKIAEEVKIALEKHLAEAGLWPPKEES